MQNTTTSKRNVILYIGAFELPDKNAAAHRVLSNAKLFQSLGYEVILVGRSRSNELSDGEIREAKYPDIEFECWETAFPKNTVAWFKQIISISNIQQIFHRRLQGRLFAVICYNYPAIAQLAAKRFANKLGGFGIADVTEWYQLLRVNKISALIKNFDTYLRMRVVNFLMDGLITTSPLLTKYYGKSYKSLAELPTLIDYKEPEDSVLEATKTGLPKRLFFAGAIFDPNAISSEKGGLKDRLDWVVELLSDAYDLEARFILEIFGVAKDEYLRIIPHHIDIVEKMDDCLVFHGRQPRKLILKTLVHCDYSIFLRKEMRVVLAGFPTKFSESISYGTPVITNGLENILPYMKEEINSIRIEYTEKNKAASRLAEVLSWPKDRVQTMKENCLSMKQFHFNLYRDEVEAMFSDLEGK